MEEIEMLRYSCLAVNKLLLHTIKPQFSVSYCVALREEHVDNEVMPHSCRINIYVNKNQVDEGG